MVQLSTNANFTIRLIAYDGGFHSKTAFQPYFKKEKAVTTNNF